MESGTLESTSVGRKSLPVKREQRAFGGHPDLIKRIEALAEVTGLSLSSVVERILQRSLDGFEVDPGLLTRPLSTGEKS